MTSKIREELIKGQYRNGPDGNVAMPHFLIGHVFN